MKLNKRKTEAYLLGSSHNCNENLSIETVNKPMKILGIYFTYNSSLKNKLNYEAALKSIFGKIQISKTIAMPKLLFQTSVLKKLNTVLFNFLWKDKDKIKRLALISEYSDGGLKFPLSGIDNQNSKNHVP